MKRNKIKIDIREAELQDFEDFYRIKSEKSHIYWSGFKTRPNREVLLSWYKNNIIENNKKKIYFIANNINDNIIGYLYVESLDNNEYEITIGVSEKYSGFGYASEALINGFNKYKLKENAIFIAWIRDDNIASVKAFEKAGFVRTNDDQIKQLNDNSAYHMIKFLKKHN